MRNKKKAVKVIVKMFGDPKKNLVARLNELKQKKATIPHEIFVLRKKFNDELGFGTPKKAEEHRTAISQLEGEGEALSMEIGKIENEIKQVR